MVHHSVDNIMQEDKAIIKYKQYTSYYKENENIDYEINETELYDIDYLSLNVSHKECCKCAFEIILKQIMM